MEAVPFPVLPYIKPPPAAARTAHTAREAQGVAVAVVAGAPPPSHMQVMYFEGKSGQYFLLGQY